ncbi:hypothetical protein VK94_08190 [Bacillus sp. LK7]|nr:hypothetical protein BK055_21190 [Bacillus velezensis]KMN56377.1 hypothetical protein VK94_08190 [Bacillus sp. LK7]MCW5196272.1 hypothetical protein [Bacillus amyloliquefaciens]ODB74169.1 hypothetical protein A7310_18105 [Bacillus velezensis]PAE74498.1 hypothetical protein CHH82_19555 [Bacillus velezensis]
MSRLHSMARFDERIPETKALGSCEGCQEVITVGEEHFNYEGDLIHDDSECMRMFLKQVSEYVQ